MLQPPDANFSTFFKILEKEKKEGINDGSFLIFREKRKIGKKMVERGEEEEEEAEIGAQPPPPPPPPPFVISDRAGAGCY